MKTIGLIGGMSWESTVTYYEVINEKVKEKLGGFHSAKILLYSVDFAEIEQSMSKNQWDKCSESLGGIARRLENAGADMVLICTNTLHKVAPQVQEQIGIPIIHIAEVTAETLKGHGIGKVALLGTRFTMLQDFYKEKIGEKGIQVMIPGEKDVETVDNIIFKELCLGIVLEESKQKLQRIIADMEKQGAEAVILGCTELGMIIKQDDSTLPVFDTTIIHARKAADLAIE